MNEEKNIENPNANIPTPQIVPTIKPISNQTKPNNITAANIPTSSNVVVPKLSVTIKPVEENKTPIVNNVEEVKEEQQIPPSTPVNKFAPPNLEQDKEKIFERESSTFFNKHTDNNNRNDGDELYKAFIGKNYEKIMMRTFSIPGFFFSIFYMFYRKMFLYGFIILILNFLACMLFPTVVTGLPFLSLIPNLFCCFFVNKLYLHHAGKKIDQIRNSNLRASLEDLKVMCARAGGTSVGSIFLYFFGATGIITAVSVILFFIGLKNSFNRVFNVMTGSYIIDVNNTSKGKDYDGRLTYNLAKNVEDKFTITIPNKFKKTSDDFEYSYKAKEDSVNKCEITFHALTEYDNDEKLITQMKERFKKSSTSQVNKQTTNNITWYWISYSGVFEKEYYYATKQDDTVYLINYEIDENNAEECDKYREEIINSIKLK